MSAKRVTLELTPAEARMVNSALAYMEADDHQGWDWYRASTMARTRAAVHAAMEAAGVQS